jgi:hypothetical protein
MSKNAPLNSQSFVRRKPSLVGFQVGEHLAMLGREQGHYYTLNETASRIWQMIEQPQKVQHLCDTLRIEYQIDAATCNHESIALLNELLTESLIEVV